MKALTYVKDRESLIAQYMKSKNLTRDEAKRDLLSILNGKEMKLTNNDPDWLHNYYNGMRSIIDNVSKLNP